MWRALPIFISSTFVDMQAERDYLRTRVFPELEERLRDRRHHLEWVDLRVGVATASQSDERMRELHVLKVCLAEVRRCRPFLIVLLGDRYGWVPPPERIRAAAEEAREGFSANIAGRSVTDLEIDFGILSDPAQQPRSIFYFREPLLYQRMPPEVAALYSDAFDPDPAAADRVRRLATLKQRIEQLLPDRVRPYAVDWDAEQNCVTGLKSWGQKVLEDFWSELEAETRSRIVPVEVSWQQAEHNALEDFVEDRAQDFVGRQDILRGLTGFATAPVQKGASWGICVSGDAGSGKSALFGELYRRLASTEVLLLAHSAAASVQAASVDLMLRRWIGELASALGIDPGLPDDADRDRLDAAFASLLGRMAQKRRVVVLIDAIDQFEASTRGQYLTWLPRTWAENARLIATAIPGRGSRSLHTRDGLDILPLPALDAAEAGFIIKAICKRYHREFEPEVIEALLAKAGADAPAWGNPLWLVLAVEELNLLDADDFARAKRGYEGTPGEQLRSLMLDMIAHFPSDIPGLYQQTFERAEELFGAPLTRGFLELIAVSRGGWRQSDFRALLPRVSGEAWDELRFAQLRRIFRGQMRLRDQLAQWDFNHAQMRIAVRARLAARSVSEQALHATIADYLLSCRSGDPMRVTETMVHLLGSGDWSKAAGFYGDPALTGAEVSGASLVLADAVLARNEEGRGDELQKVLNVLAAAGPKTSSSARTAECVAARALDLYHYIEPRAEISARHALAAALRDLYQEMVATQPTHSAWRNNLALCHLNAGTALHAKGDLRGALSSLLAARALFGQLLQDEPSDTDRLRALGVCSDYTADVLRDLGDLTGALESYAASCEILSRFVAAQPDSQSALHQLSVSQSKAGHARMAQGDFRGAMESYRIALDMVERLAAADPRNPFWQREIGTKRDAIGDVLLKLGARDAALEHYSAALGTFELLVQSDPTNSEFQNDLSVAHERVGDVLLQTGDDVPGALQSYKICLDIRSRLASADPSHSGRQSSLGIANNKLGHVAMHQRDFQAALRYYEAGRAIAVRLAADDVLSSRAQSDLANCHHFMSIALLNLGDLSGAHDGAAASLAVWQRLSDADSSNANWQFSLAQAHMALGSVQTSQGEHSAARQSCETALGLLERLAAADPENPRRQQHICAVLFGLAEVVASLGDFGAAQSHLQRAHAISNRLVLSKPEDLDRHHDLALAKSQICEVLLRQGNLPKALDNANASLAIRARLAKSKPANRDWQIRLAAGHRKVADILAQMGRRDEARGMLEKGRAICASQVAATADALWMTHLQEFDRSLAAFEP